MKIDCTNKILSAGNKRKHVDFLKEYSKLIDKNTDVEVPIYRINAQKFEEVWPPHKVNHDCEFWSDVLRDLLRSKKRERSNPTKNIDNTEINKIRNQDPCSGEFTAKSSIVFVNDIKYNELDNEKLIKNDFVESPGIYVKDKINVHEDLFDFMLAYNIHLAETYYLSNRKAMNKVFSSNDIHFKSFIVSFLTIRSLYRKNKKMVKSIVDKHSSSLVGDWKIPFILLSMVHENKWRNIVENDEIIFAIEDIMSGENIDIHSRIKDIEKIIYNFI